MIYDKKDPREHMIDETGAKLWEVSDRVEERYNWQGCFLDLCNQDPSEYVKNPIIEAIKSGATPTPVPPSGDTVVKMTSDYADSEKTSVAISIDGTIKSAFVVVMDYNDTERISTTITPETVSPVLLDVGEPIKIVNSMLLGYSEDTATSDTLKISDVIYKISKPGVAPEVPVFKFININNVVAKAMTDDELIAKIMTEGGSDTAVTATDAAAEFTLAPVYIEGLDNDLTDEEVEAAMEANYEMFFVASNKAIAAAYEGGREDAGWILNEREVIYEGATYFITSRDDIDQRNLVDASKSGSNKTYFNNFTF